MQCYIALTIGLTSNLTGWQATIFLLPLRTGTSGLKPICLAHVFTEPRLLPFIPYRLCVLYGASILGKCVRQNVGRTGEHSRMIMIAWEKQTCFSSLLFLSRDQRQPWDLLIMKSLLFWERERRWEYSISQTELIHCDEKEDPFYSGFVLQCSAPRRNLLSPGGLQSMGKMILNVRGPVACSTPWLGT